MSLTSPFFFSVGVLASLLREGKLTLALNPVQLRWLNERLSENELGTVPGQFMPILDDIVFIYHLLVHLPAARVRVGGGSLHNYKVTFLLIL